MATAQQIKALIEANSNLVNSTITDGGLLTAAEDRNIRNNLNSALESLCDIVAELLGLEVDKQELSNQSTYQNDELIGNDLSDVMVMLNGTEADTGGLVSSFDDVTGTITFIQPLTGSFKIWITKIQST